MTDPLEDYTTKLEIIRSENDNLKLVLEELDSEPLMPELKKVWTQMINDIKEQPNKLFDSSLYFTRKQLKSKLSIKDGDISPVSFWKIWK